jgi:hypothetical protein
MSEQAMEVAPAAGERHAPAPRGSRWRHFWLPATWIAGAALLWWARQSGPFDPAGRQYGANWPGDLSGTMLWQTIETLFLYLLIRPWSYSASWGRAGIALLLFAGWTALGSLTSIHSGRIITWHWGWLVLVTAGLFVTTIISAITAARRRSRSPNDRVTAS